MALKKLCNFLAVPFSIICNMAPVPAVASYGKKRKTMPNGDSMPKTKRPRGGGSSKESDLDSRIAEIELGMLESGSTEGEKQDKMVQLISMFETENPDADHNVQVAISLCRVFSRMMAAGLFPRARETGKATSILWQTKAYLQYQTMLQKCLRRSTGSMPTTMLKLYMRMLKEESLHSPDNVWISESFPALVSAIVEAREDDVRKFYAEEFLQQYQDCCYYSLKANRQA